MRRCTFLLRRASSRDTDRAVIKKKYWSGVRVDRSLPLRQIVTDIKILTLYRPLKTKPFRLDITRKCRRCLPRTSSTNSRRDNTVFILYILSPYLVGGSLFFFLGKGVSRIVQIILLITHVTSKKH